MKVILQILLFSVVLSISVSPDCCWWITHQSATTAFHILPLWFYWLFREWSLSCSFGREISVPRVVSHFTPQSKFHQRHRPGEILLGYIFLTGGWSSTIKFPMCCGSSVDFTSRGGSNCVLTQIRTGVPLPAFWAGLGYANICASLNLRVWV